MAADRLTFRIHAIRRMFQRHVSVPDVHHVLATGEVIEDYPDDTPYPTRLMLGWCGSRPLHVVAANNAEAQETIIITVYEPDPDKWEPGFKKRKQ
ncbi:MAG: DUF4258 domain-containing protein [Deltaproteobacteria bacterium]|nr:DUF4258 domain-containing protein [Deltaproteobacteria bacterium]